MANTFADEENGVIDIDASNVYEKTEFYKNNLLGTASGFHLVGLNSITNNAHVHGNILTNTLKYGSNFGTVGLKEISYAKEIENDGTINATADPSSILVVGKDVSIGLEDNGNAWSINGHKVEGPNKQQNPEGLWQDGEQVFIDVNAVEQEAIGISNELAGLGNNAVTLDNEDHNNEAIIVSDSSDYNVYNVEPGDLDFNTPIHIKGFDQDRASALIINVDMSKMENSSSFTIPNSVAEYKDGSKVSTGEVTEWSNASVVWNIYDSSQPNNLYTGEINNSGAVTGSILAPGATANLQQNLNGTVIAKDIIVTGETHRDDFVPPEEPKNDTTEVSVEKVWEGTAQDSVTIKLLADGEEVDSVDLSEETDWTHTFTDLPVVDEESGEEIEYTVEEVEIKGYDVSIDGSAGKGFTVTNTEEEDPAVDTTEVSVEKVWEGTAQDSVTINLLANGEEVDSVELTEETDWTHTFTDLPLVDEESGEEIEYTVEEVEIKGYDVSIDGSAGKGFTVTNTEKEETPGDDPEDPEEKDEEETPGKDPSESGTPGKGTSEQEVGTGSGSGTDSEESGSFLPKTATDNFNLILAGALILIIGIGVMVYRKKSA